ncbi:MAG: IS630 family transposase [Thiobacillus sp.]|nr:IS630 family transposase [Thiobacillus sp.]
MENGDARRLSPAEQHERRRQVIRAYKRGRTRAQIAAEVGLSHTAVTKEIARYEREGATGLAPRRRGRRSGEDRALTAEQEDAVRRIFCDKRPEQLKMEFALWSRAAVMQLIERECGVKLHVRSVGKYLARWGFTPQEPIKKAYEQRPEAVQAWLDAQYPEIEKRAKAEGAEIHWGDETALVNTDVQGRSDAPAGKTPVAYAVGGTRQKLSMIGTVTSQGKTRWMIIDDAFTSDKLIEFLEALIKDAGRKVFLILDNLRVHHSKPVKAWALERKDRIELFYLPSCSPELNPEERLNADLKQAIGSMVPARTKAKLKTAATEHMTRLEQAPDRVMSCFPDPHVKYAA